MVYIGCDHGGLELKAAVKQYLESSGERVEDLGTYSEASCDYPDIAYPVAERAASGGRGIVICRSGIGVSICANKVKGIRCALCTSPEMGRLCREHNDANMLALGAGNTDIATAIEIVKAFMTTDFAGGRHEKRVAKIMAYEEDNGIRGISMAKQQQISYPDREAQDAELQAALSEIFSAERQSRQMLEQAEANVNAIRQDGSTAERTMREVNAKAISAARDKAMADALERAEKDRAARIEAAVKEGEKLVSSKNKQIQARIAELYKEL